MISTMYNALQLRMKGDTVSSQGKLSPSQFGHLHDEVSRVVEGRTLQTHGAQEGDQAMGRTTVYRLQSGTYISILVIEITK